MEMEQSVPKRRHIKFRRRGITQKKTYNKTRYLLRGLLEVTVTSNIISPNIMENDLLKLTLCE
jgi:hypothetical protein